ncbi:MAG: hypothetical protein ISR83_09845 [Candidatus Marinimicrobia bacterium]|nr:hypothetical protein [Candidatus Neomarinimicrobiota bacterium]
MKSFIWLYLSSFGIMFAILSWTQDSGLLPTEPGWMKGVLACVFGAVLYYVLPRTMD